MAGEIIIRVFRLVPDVPQRFVDKTGIQRYIPGQHGYFTRATEPWHINQYGWLGMADTKNDTLISIIGDSYIENMMNPRSCNQGSLLKGYMPDYGFFEAGRSGVSFIEAMEISNFLDSTIHPKYNLLYVSNSDFTESLTNKKRLSDIVQIDLKNNKILVGTLKSPKLKKMLYSCKLLYFLYLKFPVLVNKEDKEKHQHTDASSQPFEEQDINQLFQYCQNHYKIKKTMLVFHPGADKRVIQLASQYGFRTIILDSSQDKRSWALNENDGHWSCYGHSRVAEQVNEQLSKIIIDLKGE
ncbi:hypothetical protein [Chitinophaga sp. CF418]|uniref:hypothetical protein n=1 Tax=Chitinophaga sp. CF418 TaxID=1855287 RepID=UPI00122C1E5B|nr:hypothetical protein [Chitinophaga sp. CF418]